MIQLEDILFLNALSNEEYKADLKEITDHDLYMDLASAVYVGGAVYLATKIAKAAHQTFKWYFSKAGKACKEKKYTEKEKCIQDYKKKSIDKYNSVIRKGMVKCNKSKDPAKCKSILKTKLK